MKALAAEWPPVNGAPESVSVTRILLWPGAQYDGDIVTVPRLPVAQGKLACARALAGHSERETRIAGIRSNRSLSRWLTVLRLGCPFQENGKWHEPSTTVVDRRSAES